MLPGDESPGKTVSGEILGAGGSSSDEEKLETMFRDALSLFNQSNYAINLGVALPYSKEVMMAILYMISLRHPNTSMSSPLDFFEDREVTSHTARVFADRYIHARVAIDPETAGNLSGQSLLGTMVSGARDAFSSGGKASSPRPRPLSGRENLPIPRRPV